MRVSAAWRAFRDRIDLDEYDARWERLAAQGQDVHGEADFVIGFGPRRVLDAGCGTGRVAIELDRRGVVVVGVDGDPDMLERALRRAPTILWVEADLAEFDLGRTFDVVVMAGNVLPFVDAPSRAAVVAHCAQHVEPGGHLVSGGGLQAQWPSVEDYDGWCADADLEFVERFESWDRDPWAPGAAYAVSVHRAP